MEGLEVLLCVHGFFRGGVRSFAFSLWTYLYLVYLQTLNDGDMALMDMGAEYNFYGSDITCSYPVSHLEYSYFYFEVLFYKNNIKFCYLLLKVLFIPSGPFLFTSVQ